MIEKEKNIRFRYGLKSDRFKEQRQLIEREYPFYDCYRIDEVHGYLSKQGYHLDENQIIRLSEKLFGKSHGLGKNQLVGLYARLGVEDEVQRQLKKIFDFFSGGDDYLTAEDMKNALQRLGQNLKQRQINQILSQMDLNSNGFIDFQTFLQAMLLE